MLCKYPNPSVKIVVYGLGYYFLNMTIFKYYEFNVDLYLYWTTNRGKTYRVKLETFYPPIFGGKNPLKPP
jgi:hypothetical protein